MNIASETKLQREFSLETHSGTVVQRAVYTMVELVAVIMLLLLIAGIVAPRFRGIPAFVSLDSTVNGIKRLCASARNAACLQGKEVAVIYHHEERRLVAVTAGRDETGQSFTSEFTIPVGVETEIDSEGTALAGTTLFKFFPDGSAMERKVGFRLRGQRMNMRVSPLTGCIEVEVPAEPSP